MNKAHKRNSECISLAEYHCERIQKASFMSVGNPKVFVAPYNPLLVPELNPKKSLYYVTSVESFPH